MYVLMCVLYNSSNSCSVEHLDSRELSAACSMILTVNNDRLVLDNEMNAQIRKERRRLTNDDPKDEVSSLPDFSFCLRSPESTFTASASTCPITLVRWNNEWDREENEEKQRERQYAAVLEQIFPSFSPILPWS